jgi:hypothetical protein
MNLLIREPIVGARYIAAMAPVLAERQRLLALIGRLPAELLDKLSSSSSSSAAASMTSCSYF